MNKIREKIEERLDTLENALKNNQHIAGPEGLLEIHNLVAQVAKFSSVLSGEQRDFVNSARFAIDNQARWE